MLDLFFGIWTSLFGGEGLTLNFLFILGIILFVVVFALLVALNLLSYHAKLRMQLRGINGYLKTVRAIDTQNVQKFNTQFMNNAVPTLKRGWGCFLAAQYGYPSQYMTEVDTLRSPVAKNNQKVALAWFMFVVIGFSLLFASIMSIVFSDDAVSSDILFVLFATTLLIFFGVLFYLLLKLVYYQSDISTYKLFKDFQELIDVKVELQSDMRIVGDVKNYNFTGLSNAAMRSGEDFEDTVIKEEEAPRKKKIIIKNQEPEEEVVIIRAPVPPPPPEPAPVVMSSPIPAPVFVQPAAALSRVDVICAKVDAIVSSSDVQTDTLERINVIAKRAKDNDATLTPEDSQKLGEALEKIANAIKAKQ